MTSGYARIKGPDTVVLQVGINSGLVIGSPAPMTAVTSWRVSAQADIDTVIYVANRDEQPATVELKIQSSDGKNLADTNVEVPGFGAVQIAISAYLPPA